MYTRLRKYLWWQTIVAAVFQTWQIFEGYSAYRQICHVHHKSGSMKEMARDRHTVTTHHSPNPWLIKCNPINISATLSTVLIDTVRHSPLALAEVLRKICVIDVEKCDFYDAKIAKWITRRKYTTVSWILANMQIHLLIQHSWLTHTWTVIRCRFIYHLFNVPSWVLYS